MAWVRKLRIEDLRVLRTVDVSLGPGLNVFSGLNAQGKTSILEAVALLARGRSFRTDDLPTLIRRGTSRTLASAEAERTTGPATFAVELTHEGRRFARDGREMAFREYQGYLEAAVYGTERLRVLNGGMRERRAWLDRCASALTVAYRRTVAGYEKALLQRNAALDRRTSDIAAWDNAVVEIGSHLRLARREYAEKLNRVLAEGYRPRRERYAIDIATPPDADLDTLRASFAEDLRRLRAAELQAARTLTGPHRDPIGLAVDGEDVARSASAGQARSLLLALTLAVLTVHEAETREPAIALLDDLDSELDEARAAHLCQVVAAHGQALVTTAHPVWARSVARAGQLFTVEDGAVAAA